jgi:thiol-disulfide isomerase/thioredoxin
MGNALGIAYAETGELERARSYYQIALREAPASLTAERSKELLYELDHLRVGLPGSELEEESAGANAIRLAHFRGKVVVLDFWATWCAPCVEKMEEVEELRQKYAPQGLVVIGISLDHDRMAFEKLMAEKKLPWPQVFGGKGWDSPVAKRYNVFGIPTHFVIGRDGKIVALRVSTDNLEQEIVRALK